jgi:putative chitinase
MQPIDIVQALCPRGAPAYLKAFADHGARLEAFGINTPGRLAHFLAQVLHESGGLTVSRENMRYISPQRISEIFGVGAHSAAVTPEEAEALAGDAQALAERVYGEGTQKKAAELGNTQPGDGWSYRGGGLLQTTGRAAYRRYGGRIGVDLEGYPDLIVDPRYALLPALHEWADGGCNAMADAEDIRAITRKINGGYNGLDDRKVWLTKVCGAMLQLALTAKDCDPGKIDGLPGAKTAAAVAAFQAFNGLPETGVADAQTLILLGIDPAGRSVRRVLPDDAAPALDEALGGPAPAENWR